jgi:signal transduction histidine kinase
MVASLCLEWVQPCCPSSKPSCAGRHLRRNVSLAIRGRILSSISAKGRKPVQVSDLVPAPASEVSRHLVRAQEEERKRISRELHDGTGQGLMVLRLYLGMLGAGQLDSESREKVQEALGLLDHTIEDLRRIIGRLSPQTLERLGLLPAIRKEVRELGRNTGLKTELDLPRILPRLDTEVELAIYRSVQEALHNVAKHSRARNIRVSLEDGEGTLRLLVEDDGIGFTRKKCSQSNSFGLWGMRERITALGGKLRVRSELGKGTVLRVTLPIMPQPESDYALKTSHLVSESDNGTNYTHAH